MLTLNTHSLVEENYNKKMTDFINAVVSEMPDIIALQEVNQTCTEEIISESVLTGFYPCNKSTVIRKDNHVYNTVKILENMGINYNWTWISMKLGYNKYEEGIAVMSRRRIVDADTLLISGIDDYNNWKTRKIIGISTENNPDEWFYSVHMGWWNDIEEPFEKQWKCMDKYMKRHDKVWIMGDFNNPAEITGEGYTMIKESGWYDTYDSAVEKDKGITMDNVIDGWKDKITDTDGMRIDQIWCNKNISVKNSSVIFNGINKPVVSDHYGVIVEI